MRPRTSSTIRAPMSVSSCSTGVSPPKARFGYLTKRSLFPDHPAPLPHWRKFVPCEPCDRILKESAEMPGSNASSACAGEYRASAIERYSPDEAFQQEKL